MATLIRSAMASFHWGRNEFAAYRISVSTLSPDTFFRGFLDATTLEGIEPTILDGDPRTAYDLPETVPTTSIQFLNYLDLASHANANMQSAVDDYIAFTLNLLGYDGRNRLVRTRYKYIFDICGTSILSETDVALIDARHLLLLVVVEDKSASNPADPEHQCVAEAIAAFQENNRIRIKYNLSPLKSAEIPCITMTGTQPIFYIVPVTAALDMAVATGQYPAIDTVIQRCNIISRRASTGMEDTEYRKIAFRFLIAFRALSVDLARVVYEGFPS